MASHLVRREIVEISVPTEALAHRVHDLIARLQADAIRPLLDLACSEVDRPEITSRIDRLVIDLGRIDGRNAEVEFIEQLQARLPVALRQALRGDALAEGASTSAAAGASMRASSTGLPEADQGDEVTELGPPVRQVRELDSTERHVELVAVFLRSGLLPWWADRQEARPVEQSIRALLDRAPSTLLDLIRRISAETSQLRRFTHAADDELLLDILRLMLGSPGEPNHLLGALIELATIADPGAVGTRRDGRAVPLVFEVVAAAAHIEPFDLMRSVLAARTGSTDTGTGALANLLARLDRPGRGFPGAPPVELLADRPARSQAPPSPPQPGTPATSEETAPGPSPVDRTAQLERMLTGLPEASWASAEALIGALGLHGDDARIVLAAVALSATDWPADLVDRLVRLLTGLDPGPSSPTSVRDRRIERVGDTEAVELSFSDTDVDYVGNAGLVLLTPFLGRFFLRLGLLADDRFTGPEAAQRAVGLLHHVATGRLDPVEHEVTLAKVLSGVGTEVVFEFGRAVTTDEADEAELLLRAFIEHGANIGQLSPDGLRTTFLARNGVLSVEDAGWLLQVERETFDVVLDRLPWSREWVRLPWMTAPLRVEW